jgi:hypothetical protein
MSGTTIIKGAARAFFVNPEVDVDQEYAAQKRPSFPWSHKIGTLDYLTGAGRNLPSPCTSPAPAPYGPDSIATVGEALGQPADSLQQAAE